MGIIRAVLPVKLIAGIIAASQEQASAAEEQLTASWGPVDTRSPVVPFTYTDYYGPEMGAELIRYWISFERLMDPGELAGRKRFSNTVEDRYTENGNRRVNIDPGYLTQAKLVLASTKDYSHRIYLAENIYAETTLTWQHNAFHSLPWTYPDYQSETALKFLVQARAKFQEQLAAIKTIS